MGVMHLTKEKIDWLVTGCNMFAVETGVERIQRFIAGKPLKNNIVLK